MVLRNLQQHINNVHRKEFHAMILFDKLYIVQKPKDGLYKCSYCDCQGTGKEISKHFINAHKTTKAKRKGNINECFMCKCNTFSRMCDLRQHMASRHGQRKFKCEICNASFGSRGRMNGHLEAVHAGKQYECRICQRKYKTEYNCKLHMKFTHKTGIHDVDSDVDEVIDDGVNAKKRKLPARRASSKVKFKSIEMYIQKSTGQIQN